MPLTDLSGGCYLKHRGGLYPNGANGLSGAHLAAGRAAAAQIAPLDVNGAPSAAGKYVMISVGMSNTTQEFCNDGAQQRSCLFPGFMAQAAADAFVLEGQIGQIARALKTRYPNLRQLFLSSRIYAGFATTTLNPEPYAYENGFSVKWAVESQIAQAGGAAAGRAGDLRYDTGIAPWMAWGPYLWAAGTTPRSDGLTWVTSDFASDGTHPATSGRQKVATALMTFFKTSPVTNCWFLAGQVCT